ncbi:D-alanine--poly(phosphoribitol) ligase subunit DltC [Latilactobacillus curvatus]|uniref:D-alanine--poly(phosphoribitol) ligase subunit DltC n=1 Tax=Latilactobacillus curvatus TaxID=28038 RepID=UPI000977FC05|nr:D-alanine--poly(phosphoribitol) ligase subunit DltC [Latilactobacillus curvatus]MCT3525058.1 D-alanine--poly(phosphoribitol) ligase subunit DltC [Latilactobacillus curvatus]MDG2977642.1 D-alanine--poly(phosphoribitol) ligase subunit DltC [Latilactobacillus curvatus]UTB69878.1 D-alanine--poly(phosphoribitol) ligase subunit 2 [Latilactobacillus curvatus]UTB74882.1 D-alanine--poly(phosphoribitol) ligase subunit 2 [Latilactobacillus curvatus]UTY80664.1 D-alanine--poly(phosphoribitol) ligase sub
MDVENTVVEILADLTGNDGIKDDMDMELFESGTLDSMATVQMLLELQGQLDIEVPVSEFDREAWSTPNKIIARVKELQ